MNFKAVTVTFHRNLWDLCKEPVALAVPEDNADNRIKNIKTKVEDLETEKPMSNATK
jgi:hypothetical protein